MSVLPLLLALWTVAPARADEAPAPPPPPAQAQAQQEEGCPPPRTLKKCGQLGERYYQSGQYDLAIQAFQQAYVIKPLPDLLYNMAQANRLAGHSEVAIQLYQRYLDENPNTPIKDEITGYIAQLREKQEQDRKAAEQQKEQDRLAAEARANSLRLLVQPPPPPPKPLYKRWWLWTAVGGVVAGAVVVGVVVGTRPGETTLQVINARSSRSDGPTLPPTMAP